MPTDNNELWSYAIYAGILIVFFIVLKSPKKKK